MLFPSFFFGGGVASSERVNLAPVTPSWSEAEVISAVLTVVAPPFLCPLL